MPTYKQVVNHVKKHVLWKDEYFERYYRLNPELVQKRLDKIYQAEDDLMVLISTQLFCFLQANGTLYFDGCYKTGKADNSLLCTNLALWSIELACDHFDIREERGHTTKFSEQGESWLTLFACNQFSLVPYCYPAIQRGFQSGVLKEIVPFYREQKYCDGVHLRQPVEGGIGEQNAIQPQFLMPVRIMPDFDIFTDGPATVLAVLNLWIQISQTAGASGDWWHSQHRPKQYRVDPSFQTSGGRSHQFVSARQYKAACNEADEFSARVICEGSRFRLLS